MILIVDNFDSFTFNLVQYIGSINDNLKIIKNNELSIEEILDLNISHIVISPGPGRPENSGVCLEIMKYMSKKTPILGICLGHQIIGYHYGAKIVNSKRIMHGKTSIINHNRKSKIFNCIPPKFNAIRYHSLVINKNFENTNLNITALSDDKEIMGIEHKKYPIYGIQFHPESVLTDYGKIIIENFLKIIV